LVNIAIDKQLCVPYRLRDAFFIPHLYPSRVGAVRKRCSQCLSLFGAPARDDEQAGVAGNERPRESRADVTIVTHKKNLSRSHDRFLFFSLLHWSRLEGV